MIMEKIGTLEDEALKRKERLKELKTKQWSTDKKNKDAPTVPRPVFRNYTPNDEKLKETILEPAKPGNVEEEIKDQLEAANTRVIIEDLDITSLAPRKPDWDLKRDAAKKLERLEKRTQRAIAELIRERLKSEQHDFASKVAIGAETAAALDDDD
ncbi:coiled-coil domain-containing protein 12 [Halyomorpha halys]|uniref:coiled-coil domain-containing protein 12 n=1 Tax=Halyomorpha halys TaxID=286706 RepID=UPI0006D4F793|nr:coiled-coil domain-containing protein 12 [Halyomorpha halys]